MKNRPIIDKKIVWEINTGYLELIDDNVMFGTVDLSNLTGHFLVYNSKETKCDVDVHKVIIQNHMEKKDDYKWVLFPGYSENNPRPLDHMLRVRIRDKFLIVHKAPWKIFDQFEIFLNSMTVKLTRDFYRKIQQFMLFKEEQKKLDEMKTMKDEKKINMLMPNNVSDLEYTKEEIEEIKTNTLNIVDEEDDSDGESISNTLQTNHNRRESQRLDLLSGLQDSSDDEREQSEIGRRNTVIETTTKSFQKMNMKTASPTARNKKKSKPIFEEIKEKLALPFKTVRNIKPKQDKEESFRHPMYFRYFRINEIGVALTYKHSENSLLNTKNLRITIKPFLKHCKYIHLISL